MTSKITFLQYSKKALRAHEEGRFTHAYNLLGKALLEDSLRPESVIKIEAIRADCLLNSGNYDRALEHLAKIEILYSDYDKTFVEIASFYYKIDEFALAKKYFFKAIRVAPVYLDLYHSLSRLFIDTNEYNNAIVTLKKALTVKKSIVRCGVSRSVILIQLGLSYFYREKPAMALKYFRLAEIEDDSKLYDRDIYARCLLQEEYYKEALIQLDRFLLEVGTDDNEIYLLKAKALIKLGRIEEAKEMIRTAKENLGELLIYPADIKYFSPLLSNGFMTEIGAVLVEDG